MWGFCVPQTQKPLIHITISWPVDELVGISRPGGLGSCDKDLQVLRLGSGPLVFIYSIDGSPPSGGSSETILRPVRGTNQLPRRDPAGPDPGPDSLRISLMRMACRRTGTTWSNSVASPTEVAGSAEAQGLQQASHCPRGSNHISRRQNGQEDCGIVVHLVVQHHHRNSIQKTVDSR